MVLNILFWVHCKFQLHSSHYNCFVVLVLVWKWMMPGWHDMMMTRWHSKMTWWQEVSQTTDRMVYSDLCNLTPTRWTIFSMVSPLMVECLSRTILIEFQVWARDRGPCLHVSPHHRHWSVSGVNVGLWMSVWMLSKEPTLALLKNIFIATNIVAKSIVECYTECKVY